MSEPKTETYATANAHMPLVSEDNAKLNEHVDSSRKSGISVRGHSDEPDTEPDGKS